MYTKTAQQFKLAHEVYTELSNHRHAAEEPITNHEEDAATLHSGYRRGYGCDPEQMHGSVLDDVILMHTL